jgi:hypothetical protein
VWEQFVFYNSRIVEKMKTIDFILDGKFHLHTPKKEGFRTKSKVALKKKGALFGHSSFPLPKPCRSFLKKDHAASIGSRGMDGGELLPLRDCFNIRI